ncbi:MAG: carboxypeptidase-like regulatory domain-containing protein [Prevotella sp.]|nr:carboxypeptidase-like regulatory domain-containing protein [Prevotella sp.]MCI2080746.1 carboxypeptidase-like regulatory domain-containing protein [Prevotella sp.]MCI2102679.1 carboxypeptidase-like regulatory domain-containing protein [Prevotella sp.]
MNKKIVLVALLISVCPVLPSSAREDRTPEPIEENLAIDHVTGVVKDAKGEPIVGASIVEEGTHNAAVSDVNGKFNLKLEGKGHSIRVSYVGFTTQTLKLVKSEQAHPLGDGKNPFTGGQK